MHCAGSFTFQRKSCPCLHVLLFRHQFYYFYGLYISDARTGSECWPLGQIDGPTPGCLGEALKPPGCQHNLSKAPVQMQNTRHGSPGELLKQ